MVSRRAFIFGTAGIAAGLLTNCSPVTEDTLKVTALQGSVPAEVLQSFRRQLETPVRFQLTSQIVTLFQQLQRWQQPQESSGFAWGDLLPWTQSSQRLRPDNLMSLGDYWLEAAIAQNLIEPIDLPSESLDRLPQTWRQFVSRSQNGQISETDTQLSLWAAPYKVQTLVIAYRQSFFPQSSSEAPPFQTWQDLLQPQLRSQIALPDHPRLVLGLLQKIREGSFNFPVDSSATARQLSQLQATFNELNAQVKTYDSTNSLKALVNQDVMAVVAWSGEVVSALRRYQDLRIAVPNEGSLLSADLWVRPRGAEMTAAAQQWIDFCWQNGPATQISVSDRGISPVFLTEDAEIPEALADSRLPISTLRSSEPLLPIPAAVQAAYFDLWQTLRQS